MTDSLEFYKMVGAGNDFIVLDRRKPSSLGTPPEKLAVHLCARALSVGADGLVLIENSQKANFRAHFFNRDGSQVAFCANGARCAARFGFIKVIAGRRMSIETACGVLSAEVLPGGNVILDMPGPPSEPARVSAVVDGRTIPGFSTTVGVPHFVVIVKDIERVPVAILGRKLRSAEEFGKAGTNVDFVSMEGGEPYPIRTYERGVEDETLSCGSGAAAAAWVLHQHEKKDTFPMKTRSGETITIAIDTSRALPRLSISGEARVVYVGNLSLSSIIEKLEC